MKKDQNVQKIVIHYDNGEQKELVKGLVAFIKLNEDGKDVHVCEFCNQSGKELYKLLAGFVRMADQLGMFDSKEEDE